MNSFLIIIVIFLLYFRVIETSEETEERLKKWEAYLIATGSTEKNDAHESDSDSVKTKSGGESDDEMPSTNQTTNNENKSNFRYYLFYMITSI